MTENNKSKALKVAFVDHSSLMGGAEYSLYHLLNRLNYQKYEPYLIIPENSELEAKLKKNTYINYTYHPLSSTKKILQFVVGIISLARKLRLNKIEIVHTNSYRGSLYGLIAGKIARKKTVWHVRDINENFIFTKLMPLFADKIIAISSAVAEQFNSKVVKEKVCIINNGVNLTDFQSTHALSAENLKEELQLPQETILIGMVGRINRWKGFHYLIEALPAILEKYPNVKLAIVGAETLTEEKGYLQELEGMCRELDLVEKVYFLGERSDIPNIMKSLDIFVSYSDSEPFGRVIIEAMAAGTPVIVADSGGAPEIIKGKDCGLIVETANTLQLTKGVNKLISCKSQWVSMGENGKKHVFENFNADLVNKKVYRVYEELLKNN
ncbi:glycosyltransferase family 4 protein [Priestia aryabhattai]|uniref:glycosyltransferase family 4 protein n=1 Tax=Priestia aryabhattai TaxID=412384 RepID=UPI002E1CEE24|nr:glycosyltransferase family 4 protein [Priestia aryabhattai]